MILTADIYAAGGRELLGKADLEIWCGDAFCDSCGDCLACYVGDPCGYDGGFLFLSSTRRTWPSTSASS